MSYQFQTISRQFLFLILCGLLSVKAEAAVHNDIDGDGRSDYVLYNSENSNWFVLQSSGGFLDVNLGSKGSIPVLGDYDGDGSVDLAVYNFETAEWLIRNKDGELRSVFWGWPGHDIPVPADYDGDGITDISVLQSGVRWVGWLSARNEMMDTSFGPGVGVIPLPADYDGDGKADLSVLVEETNTWYSFGSTLGYMELVVDCSKSPFLAVPADYDGDGVTERAVYCRKNSTYMIHGRDGLKEIPWGQPGVDLPVPADYDGDGVSDLAARRENEFFVLRTSEGFLDFHFGRTGYLPVDLVGAKDLSPVIDGQELTPGQTIAIEPLAYDSDWVVEFEGVWPAGGRFDRILQSRTDRSQIDSFWDTDNHIGLRLSNRNIFYTNARVGTISNAYDPSAGKCVVVPNCPDHLLQTARRLPLKDGAVHTLRFEYSYSKGHFKIYLDGALVGDWDFIVKRVAKPITSMYAERFSGIFRRVE